jgi:hypothetical protein
MEIRLTGTRGQISVALANLQQTFGAVEFGEAYVGDEGFTHCDVRVTF